ncbi:hypothetical protein D1872_217570 [compost metagenome]
MNRLGKLDDRHVLLVARGRDASRVQADLFHSLLHVRFFERLADLHLHPCPTLKVNAKI